MKKYAWTWKIKDGYLDEYVKYHKNPWPEIMEAHKKAGFHNYSIFQNGNQFFYVFETDDPEAAFAYTNADKDCQRWNEIMTNMIEGGLDPEENPIMYLEEVFYLK